MSTLFVAKANQSVANTTNETTLLSETVTLLANYVVGAGATARLTLYGSYNTDIVAPTLRLRVKLGATLVGDSGAVTVLLASSAAFPVAITVLITFQAAGATGSVVTSGYAIVNDGTGASNTQVLAVGSAATNSIDTTVDQTINVTAQWGTASPSNGITIRNAIIELLDPAT